MTVSSVVFRSFLVGFLLMLAACASVSDEEIFGYEEDFTIPEPDMVPVTPDDKPGRTVDEMLSLTSQAVTVKKAQKDADEAPRPVYERAGRFGSKEKISLRKGLNAPDSGIAYSSETRTPAQTVRPLELKKYEKDELLTISEEEMLAEIIAPKTEKIEMIEVVGIDKEQNDQSSVAQKPAEQQIDVLPTQPETPVVEPKAQKIEEKPAKVDMIALVPAKKTQPEQAAVEPLVETQTAPSIRLTPPVRLTPPSERESIVLTPPSAQENIVLTAPDMPDTPETDSSVEIFFE